MRGLCLGIVIGLFLTVVVPWLFDLGFLFAEKVQESDLALPDLNKLSNDLSAKLNETAKNLWRVDQDSQQRSSFLRHQPPPTPPPTRDPRVVADETLFQKFPRHNRTVTLVHVGHTGGQLLIQKSPSLKCRQEHAKDASQIQSCIEEQQKLQDMVTTVAKLPLAREAKYYFHLGSIQHAELQQSTSFLFTLRNPVDRILAIFHDAHPLSCTAAAATDSHRPHGCETTNYWNMPGTQQHSFYTKCFPQVDPPEAFCQAVTSPWPDISGEERLVKTVAQQQHDCRWMAREVVAGTNVDLAALAPHMHFNYEYYVEQSLWKYPSQEILVVRAEHEQKDLNKLNSLLLADSTSEGMDTLQQPFPAPSAPLLTPTVTPEAYAKVCCVLEKEIEIYESILNQAINLPVYVKEDTMDDLRRKCGLSEQLAWAEWRVRCKDQIEMDSVLLTPNP